MKTIPPTKQEKIMFPFLYAFIISCIVALLTSCGTTVLLTTSEPATIVETDSTWCFEKPFSASINEDSIVEVLDEGVILGNDKNSIKLYWQSTSTDPFNGQLVAEPNLCISGSDFCLNGRYVFQVHKNNLTAMLKTGITFGTPLASIYLFYEDGKATALPKICLMKAKTSKSLR